MARSISAFPKTRAAALITTLLVAQVGAGLGVVGSVARLASSTLPAQAGPPTVDVVDVNQDAPTAAPPEGSGVPFGGRVSALAIAPPSGANNRLILAATQFGGLWSAFVDPAGTTLIGAWQHVDTFPGKQLVDVKVFDDPQLVAMVTVINDTSVASLSGIWKGTYTPGAGGAAGTWSWLQATHGFNAFRVAVQGGAPGAQEIFVASDRGLQASGDSGKTFTEYDPTPKGPTPLWDVVLHRDGSIDVCGLLGFFRSTVLGTWTAQDLHSPLAQGAAHGADTVGYVCRLALGPNEQVFAAINGGTTPSGCFNDLFEAADVRAVPPRWVDMTPSGSTNCQPPFVAVGPASSPARFDVYFGDSVRIVHQVCIADPAPAGIPGGCQAGQASWSAFDAPKANGADPANVQHTDPAFLLIDSQTNQGCPFLEANDGGVFAAPAPAKWSQATKCNDGSPSGWVSFNHGLHALDALSIQGTAYTTGTPHTDLYAGLQDNGLIMSNDSGGHWTNVDGAEGRDIYGVWASPQEVNGSSTVVFNEGQPSAIRQGGENLGPSTITWAPPPALPPIVALPAPTLPPGFDSVDSLTHQFPGNPYGFRPNVEGQGDLAAPFGLPNDWAVLTADAKPDPHYTLWVTFDNGRSWLPEGSVNGPGVFTGLSDWIPMELRATDVNGDLTFFMLLDEFPGSFHPFLAKYSAPKGGISTSATPTLLGVLKGPRLFAVDPSNPNLMMVDDVGTCDVGCSVSRPEGIWTSSDGGQTFSEATGLETAIRQGGKFNLDGQVTTIDYDSNSRTIVVGTVDAGVFVSLDWGLTWNLMRGSDQLHGISGTFFDPRTHSIFISTQGRGIWKVTPPPEAITFFPASGSNIIGHLTPIRLGGTGIFPIKSVSYRIIAPGKNPAFTKVSASSVTIELKTQPDGPYTIESFVTDSSGRSSPVLDQQVVLSSSVGGPVNLQISPSPLDFGDVGIGTLAGPATITATQNGSATLAPMTVSIGGVTTGVQDFTLEQDGCSGKALGPGQSCSVTVSFYPSAAGLRQSSLLFHTTVDQTVSLRGTGMGPAVDLQASPQFPSFGSVVVLHSAGPQTFSVTEAGPDPVGITGLLPEPPSPDFTITQDGCTGTVLQAGGSCSFGVSFEPTVVGPEQESVVIEGTSGGSAAVTISGTGQQLPLLVSGDQTLFTSCLILDQGTGPCDLTVDPQTGIVSPGPGVRIAYAGFPGLTDSTFNLVDPVSVVRSQYTFDPIQPSVGEQFNVYTSHGNFAAVLVTAFGDGGGYIVDMNTWSGAGIPPPPSPSFTVGQAIAGGSGQVAIGQCFNFDDGVESCAGDSDVSCDVSTCPLTPTDGAQVADLGNMTDAQYAAVDESTLANASYSSTPFPQSAAPRDEVLAIRTSRGNYAKVQVLSAQDWIFNYTTYAGHP